MTLGAREISPEVGLSLAHCSMKPQHAAKWSRARPIRCMRQQVAKARRAGNETVAKRSVSSDQDSVVIKKYANRRLYNTATSSYVTLDHLSEMVKQGQNFVVHDAKTGEDITPAQPRVATSHTAPRIRELAGSHGRGGPRLVQAEAGRADC